VKVSKSFRLGQMANTRKTPVADGSPGTSLDQSGLRLDEHRVSQLLEIAAEEFLSKGFAAASLSNIARRSKASKTTFYARFPNKEQLFLAVMKRLMNSHAGEILSSLPVDLSLEEGLRHHARTLLKYVLTEEQIALNRIAVMEAPNFPSFAEQFFNLGPKRGEAFLSEYFTRKIEAGDLVNEDPIQMAEHYFSLLFGGRVKWTVMRLRTSKHSPAKLGEHIEGVLKVFLRAYAAPVTKHVEPKPGIHGDGRRGNAR
jgi:TetR/AcrR family transcriptional regulator, mexJK operon transcriptional repressor